MHHSIIKILLIVVVSANMYAITNEEWRNTHLSHEEKEWVKNNPIITYSEVNWKPLSIIENNAMTGIMGDYLELISKKTGIKMKFISSKSWSDVLNKFKQGKIDVVPGVSGVNNLGSLSKAYATFPMVAVTNDNNIKYIKNLQSVKDKVFSVPKYWTSWTYIKKQIPNAKILETESLEEAILNVEQKKADIFIGHIAVASHAISTTASSLRISGELDFVFNHHYVTHKKDKHLLSIINKVFDSMSENDKVNIYSRWAFSKVKMDVDYTIVFKVILAIIIIFILFIIYGTKLKNALATTKKQQEILNESIDYALTVQMALMSNNHTFDDYFHNSLSLWIPKDKVGGDIYLSRKVSNDEVLIYVIDCIGHGIPGALLTVYVKAIEQQILPHFKNINEPLNTAKILDFFHTKMLGLYGKNIDSKEALCFDGAVLLYSKKSKTIKFSGANTPIFYIQNNDIKVLKTNRRIIGISSKRDKEFIEHIVDINIDTFFYISTDGLIDQIGGKNSLPLGKVKLKSKFLEIHKKSDKEQKKEIIDMLTSHQRKNPRLDDITLVGFEIKV